MEELKLILNTLNKRIETLDECIKNAKSKKEEAEDFKSIIESRIAFLRGLENVGKD